MNTESSTTPTQSPTFERAPDADGGPVALRTPLYLIVSVFGLLILVGAFLPWAGVKAFDGDGVVAGSTTAGTWVSSVNGMDAGGWGLSAMIAGLAIAVLGLIGYFWNPFSDPEATFIAGFSAVTAVAALVKIIDAPSLYPIAADFEAPTAGSRFGLWLILAGAIASLLSGLWILYSRPRAQARLTVGDGGGGAAGI